MTVLSMSDEEKFVDDDQWPIEASMANDMARY